MNCRQSGSNRRPLDYETNATTNCAIAATTRVPFGMEDGAQFFALYRSAQVNGHTHIKQLAKGPAAWRNDAQVSAGCGAHRRDTGWTPGTASQFWGMCPAQQWRCGHVPLCATGSCDGKLGKRASLEEETASGGEGGRDKHMSVEQPAPHSPKCCTPTRV